MKDAYRSALAPYREACGRASVACEYEGGRSANVSEKVFFLVEKTDKGVRMIVKGRPKTEEVILLAALKESILEGFRHLAASGLSLLVPRPSLDRNKQKQIVIYRQ